MFVLSAGLSCYIGDVSKWCEAPPCICVNIQSVLISNGPCDESGYEGQNGILGRSNI